MIMEYHMQFRSIFIALMFTVNRCCSDDGQLVVGPMSMTMKSMAQGRVVSSPDGGQQSHKHMMIYPRYYNQDDWLTSLIWNLIGYSTVIIPGFLFIRMAKYSNFNERDGRGALFRFVQVCIFGSQQKIANDPEAGDSTKTKQSSTRLAVKLVFCAGGLQIAYLTWGILQERVMTRRYGTGKTSEHFKESQFLVFMNRFSAMVLSGIWIFVKRQGSHGAPFYKYSFSSLSNILSSWCQYEALKYVSFPTQVLGKASKMIPVMFMGKIVSRKTYQYYEYFTAVMISIGVSLFLLSVASTKYHSAKTSFAGVILMIGYMGFDSFTSNWQSELITQHKLTSIQVMFGTNVFSSLFTIVSLFQNGGLFSSVSFIYNHPDFGYHAIAISIASALGQLFIFYTIATFGPLLFTCIMVTRQMFSMLLSCIIYQHSMSPQAVLGIAVVFSALFLQVYAKWRTRKIQQRQAGTMSKV